MKTTIVRSVMICALLGVMTLASTAGAQQVDSRDDLAPMGCFLGAGLQAPGVVSHILSARALHQQLDLFSSDPTHDTLANAAIAAHVTETAFYGVQAGLWVVRGGMILGRSSLRRSTHLISAGMLDAAMGAGGAVVGAVLFGSRKSMNIGGVPGDLLKTSATVHLMFGLGSLVAGIVEILSGVAMREDEHYQSRRSSLTLVPSPGGLSAVVRW